MLEDTVEKRSCHRSQHRHRAAAALEFGGSAQALRFTTTRTPSRGSRLRRHQKTWRQALAIGGDLGVAGTAKRVVEEAAKQLGRLDILLNNAGAMIRRSPFLELDADLYDAAMNLNVRSVIEASQAAVPHMEKQGGGAIINVGSIAGSDGGGTNGLGLTYASPIVVALETLKAELAL